MKPKVLLVAGPLPARCWEVLGRRRERLWHPYPQLRLENGHQVSASKHIFEQAKGPVPDGLHIHRICGNKRCVNPDHLRLGPPGPTLGYLLVDQRIVQEAAA